jgi:hypothetical protein
VRFVVDTPDGRLFFTNAGITFALPVSTGVETSTIGLSNLPETASKAVGKAHVHTKMLVAAMRFAGNNPMPQIKSDSVLPTTFNYFIGDNQSKWYTDVASYSSIHYQGIYPGIDLHYDSNHGQMKVPILWLQALIPARSAGTTMVQPVFKLMPPTAH